MQPFPRPHVVVVVASRPRRAAFGGATSSRAHLGTRAARPRLILRPLFPLLARQRPPLFTFLFSLFSAPLRRPSVLSAFFVAKSLRPLFPPPPPFSLLRASARPLCAPVALCESSLPLPPPCRPPPGSACARSAGRSSFKKVSGVFLLTNFTVLQHPPPFFSRLHRPGICAMIQRVHAKPGGQL